MENPCHLFPYFVNYYFYVSSNHKWMIEHWPKYNFFVLSSQNNWNAHCICHNYIIIRYENDLPGPRTISKKISLHQTNHDFVHAHPTQSYNSSQLATMPENVMRKKYGKSSTHNEVELECANMPLSYFNVHTLLETWTHFVSTLCVFRDTVSDEDRIGHLDEDIVHTVDVYMFDASRCHILHDSAGGQSSVKSPIAICQKDQK